MKRTLLALLVAGLAFAGTAEGATTKRCGSLGADGKPYVDGAGNVDITARVTTCKTARSVVRAWKGRDRVRGYRCTYDIASSGTKVRCTNRGGRLIRWRSVS